MIGFDVKQRSVVLEYEPELNVGWVRTELNTHRQVTISRAFTFKKSDLISGPSETEDEEIDEPVFRFRLATRKDGYFRIAGRILGIANDVLIVDQGVTLERKLFVAERNIGIFRRIAKVKQDDGEIVVGGDREDSIPIDVFRELLERNSKLLSAVHPSAVVASRSASGPWQTPPIGNPSSSARLSWAPSASDVPKSKAALHKIVARLEDYLDIPNTQSAPSETSSQAESASETSGPAG